VPPTSVDKDNTSKDLNKCCGGAGNKVGLVDRSGAVPKL
jgi:hypothetical protein